METETPETDECYARAGMMLAAQVDELDATCRKLECQRDDAREQRDEAREQRDRLEESILNLSHPNCVMLIRDFCEGQGWAAQTWKNQPHIKPLFDFANAKGDSQSPAKNL